MEFNPNMVATMKNNNASSVFINESGEWLFHKTEGFKEYSREDVGLSEVEIKEVAPKVKKQKVK